MELDVGAGEPCAALFGEDGARFLLAATPRQAQSALAALAERAIPARVVGRITEDATFRVTGAGERPRERLFRLWDTSIEERMKRIEESA
jgi:selenophosphate synthetase-related protein